MSHARETIGSKVQARILFEYFTDDKNAGQVRAHANTKTTLPHRLFAYRQWHNLLYTARFG